MVFQGFWGNLARPIIGLSPMDGVTDAPMRFITKKYGSPDVVFTEFTSAEGIRAGALRLMKDFVYSESERPIVAQLFGADPEAFYQAAIVVSALGFDGVDLNMGCPAKSVESQGAGASLINNPKLAGKIVAQVKKGLDDWVNGLQIEDCLSPKIVEYLNLLDRELVRKIIPVSIKTRIGYDKPDTEEWIGQIVSFEPALISVHGRTLKQLYSGAADWNEIGKAALQLKNTKTLILGNGDVSSRKDALEKAEIYQLDGVLIGRAALGNPYVFKDIGIGKKERLKLALEHAKKYEEIFPKESFLPMRKHLAWYAHGFANASDLRQKLVLTNSSKEAEKVILSESLGN